MTVLTHDPLFDLRQKRQWVTYRLERDAKGRLDKIPYAPGTNQPASSTDPTTWTDYRTAVAKKNGDAGLGFVFTKEFGITGIDFDKCRDPITGKVDSLIAGIVAKLHSYTEISQSGTGIHVLVKASLPVGARKRGSCEMYDSERFFVVTENPLLGTPLTIEQADIRGLHRWMTAGVFNRKKHPTLWSLLNGSDEGYESASEADLACCGKLRALELSPEDIDAIIRLSARYRPKWDERHGSQTYGEMTIAKAMEGRSKKGKAPSGISLISTENGSPRPLLENARVSFQYSPEWSGVLGFNAFSGRVEMLKLAPGFPADPDQFPRPLTDRDLTLATTWLQRQGIFINSTKIVGQAIDAVARQFRYHPCSTIWKRWFGTGLSASISGCIAAWGWKMRPTRGQWGQSF